MKKTILSILLFTILLFGVVGCDSKDNNKYTNLVDVEKIYYHEIDNNQISMYIVYSIKSDENQDFYVGKPANIQSCYATDDGGSSCTTQSSTSSYILNNDENQDLIEAAGFSLNEEYKTLKAGSDEKEKYIIEAFIDKEFLKDQDDTYLVVGLSTRLDTDSFIATTTVKKKYKFSEVETFKYSDNSEFVEEFKKDYHLN